MSEHDGKVISINGILCLLCIIAWIFANPIYAVWTAGFSLVVNFICYFFFKYKHTRELLRIFLAVECIALALLIPKI